MKPAVSFLIALSTLPLAAASNANDQVIVELRQQAMVTAAQIRLADIADVRGAEAALQQRLQEVRIAPSPHPGASRTFRAGEIEPMLRSTAGAHVVVVGAPAVKVDRPAVEYDGTALVEAARQHVIEHVRRLCPDVTRVEVVAMTKLPNFRGPAGAWQAKPRPMTSKTVSKRTNVWLDIHANGAIYRSVPIWFSVSAYRPVVVAKRAFHAKERIVEQELMTEERDVAALSSIPVATVAKAMGMRARRAIVAGSVLHVSDIEAQPSVLAEQEIDVRVMVGPIAIDTKAVAEEEGGLGEVIRVRNQRSTQTYVAQVIGEKKVLVKE